MLRASQRSYSGPVTAAASIVVVYMLASWMFLKDRRLGPIRGLCTRCLLCLENSSPPTLTWLAHLIVASAQRGLSREALLTTHCSCWPVAVHIRCTELLVCDTFSSLSMTGLLYVCMYSCINKKNQWNQKPHTRTGKLMITSLPCELSGPIPCLPTPDVMSILNLPFKEEDSLKKTFKS